MVPNLRLCPRHLLFWGVTIACPTTCRRTRRIQLKIHQKTSGCRERNETRLSHLRQSLGLFPGSLRPTWQLLQGSPHGLPKRAILSLYARQMWFTWTTTRPRPRLTRNWRMGSGGSIDQSTYSTPLFQFNSHPPFTCPSYGEGNTALFLPVVSL